MKSLFESEVTNPKLKLLGSISIGKLLDDPKGIISKDSKEELKNGKKTGSKQAKKKTQVHEKQDK
ncbi:32289_t:CDS:2 [Gigaspora margarita]|uniref:32289_t:CDS:1 n=1 Tax=Gigaspora margarita TaxID=4874 RepID=A0ABN7W418_GIGMA|nr:32289_t:CDS:2 [Gigaspora margarita]